MQTNVLSSVAIRATYRDKRGTTWHVKVSSLSQGLPLLQSTPVRLLPFALVDGHRQSWLDELHNSEGVVVSPHRDVDLSMVAKATGWGAVAA